MYGCDCYAYGLLAAGYCDLVVEADLKPYDYMALVSKKVFSSCYAQLSDWLSYDLVVEADLKPYDYMALVRVLVSGYEGLVSKVDG